LTLFLVFAIISVLNFYQGASKRDNRPAQGGEESPDIHPAFGGVKMVAGNARTPRGERCEQRRFNPKGLNRPSKLYA